MSLRNGPLLVPIPGPSIVPERVRLAMDRAMPNIYAGELVDVSAEVLAELPSIARTSGHAFCTIGNGHSAWQMAICNTLSRGEKVLVLDCGRFAAIWGYLAEASGVEVEVLDSEAGRGVDPAAVTERLSADAQHKIKAILMVHADTASSAVNDLPAIRRAIDDAGHPTLLMVDCIASLGCMPYEMDEWGIDLTVGASQKGLMVPPGLGFVWAGQRAVDAYETAGLRVGYFDWTARMADGPVYSKYGGTPPVSHLFGMQESLRMIAEEGIENVWSRHAVLAGTVHAAVATWSAPGGIDFYVTEPSERAHSVTTVLTNNIDADELRHRCEHGAGVVLGVGIGDRASHSFRIGHMGHTNPPVVLGALATIEAALKSMDAPLGGSGVASAAEAIAQHL
ncbi:MAG: aminotransferase class V-fold PLP-dependent enzyme [Actinomycetia bacterium]|nr:aminotransferase class V-fold PLP-dependent enzyme [Actinomycetes bacterium]